MLHNSEANKQKKMNSSVNNRCSSTVKYEKQIPRSSKPNNVNVKSQANGLPLPVEEKSSLSSSTISSNSLPSIMPKRKTTRLSRDDHILWKLYPGYILHPMVQSKTSYHKLSLGSDILPDLSLKETPRYQSLSIDDGIVPNRYSSVVEKPKYLHLSLDERSYREDHQRLQAEAPVQTHKFEKNDLNESPCIDTEPNQHNCSSDKGTLQNSNLDRELFNCLEKFKRKINERFHKILDSELSEFVEDLKTKINNEFSDYKEVQKVPTLRELALRSLEAKLVDQISSTDSSNGWSLLVEDGSSLNSLTISSSSLPSIKPKRKSTKLSRDDHTLWKLYPGYILHPKVESKSSYLKLSLGSDILQDQSLQETPRYQSLSIDGGIVPNQYSGVVEKPIYLHLSLVDENTYREDHQRLQAGTPVQTHMFEKNDINEDPLIDTEPKHHSFSSDKGTLQNSNQKREFYERVEEFIRKIHEQSQDSKKGEKVPRLIEFPLRIQDAKAIDNIISTHLTNLKKPPNLSSVTTSSSQVSSPKVDCKPDAVKKKENNNKPTKKRNKKKHTTAREPWVN